MVPLTTEGATAGIGKERERPGTPRLREWMGLHGSELRRHLVRVLGSESDADDVLQDVWITAHRSPPDDGPGSNVRAWLYRVATNAALDRLARDRRRSSALERRRLQLVPETRPAPDDFLAKMDDEVRRRVREKVAALPRKQREAVWLRWAEGADYRAIARKLECSEDSARANVYQAMKRLRSELFEVWKQERAG